jgi:hypothetical protein
VNNKQSLAYMCAIFIETLTDKSAENSVGENTETNEYGAFDDNEQLTDKITTLAGQINAANYRFLKLMRRIKKVN